MSTLPDQCRLLGLSPTEPLRAKLSGWSIGDTVRHRLHTKDDNGWRGLVTAIENYTDAHGSRTWYYVEWLDPHGAVPREPVKHHAGELRELAT